MTQRDVNSDPRGSTPVPDPTVLTTQQLTIGLASLREILETRLDAMDTATELNKEQMDKIPQMIHESVVAVEKIRDQKFLTVDEKFRSIETQFKERDTRTEQSSKDSKVAVDAALQAAKEAVGEQNKSNALAIAKSETAFTKQLDQIMTLIAATSKTSDEKINDLKSRLDRGEGGQGEFRDSRTQQNVVTGWFIAVALALIGNAVTLVYLFTHK